MIVLPAPTPVIVPHDGAHLTHLLARYRAGGMVEASREQEKRKAAWAALVRRGQ